jgi:predicted lipid-binding transport protein (Tim44 family)
MESRHPGLAPFDGFFGFFLGRVINGLIGGLAGPFLRSLFCLVASLYFCSTHGAVLTAASATSCRFHHFLNATCVVFGSASATPCRVRARQGHTAGRNQAGNTKTSQDFFKIHFCHFTLLLKD